MYSGWSLIFWQAHNFYSTYSNVHSILLWNDIYKEKKMCSIEASFSIEVFFLTLSVLQGAGKVYFFSTNIRSTCKAVDLIRWVMKYMLRASWGIFVSSCFFPWTYSNYFCIIRKEAVKIINCLAIDNWVSSVIKSPSPSLLVIHWQFLSNSNEEYISSITVHIGTHLFFWYIQSFMTLISLKHKTLFSPGLWSWIHKILMQKSSIG